MAFSQQVVSPPAMASSQPGNSESPVYTKLTVVSTTEVPRDSSVQVDSDHCTVLKNVQQFILTSRQTKRNVAAFLLNCEDDDDNDNIENETGIRIYLNKTQKN